MYTDLLAKIKNAAQAKKDNFSTAFSTMDLEIAELLVERGYLKDIQKKNVGNKKFLEIRINYRNGTPVVNGFKIISRPSRHTYIGYRDIKPVKQGYGLGVFSTPSGILTDRETRKKKIGGEYLFEIW